MKHVAVLMTVALCLALSGCGSGAETPVREEAEETAALTETIRDNVPETVSEEPVEAPRQNVAEFSRDGIFMTLPIFEDWEYERIETDGAGIRFWRSGDLKGYAELLYYDVFGVCGTGLEQKETEFPSGQRARIGYYDGGKDWNFVIFDTGETKGDYAAVNHGLTSGDATLALSMLGLATIGE